MTRNLLLALALVVSSTAARSQSFEPGAFTGKIPGDSRGSSLEITSFEGALIKATLDVPGKTKNNPCFGSRVLSGAIVDGELVLQGEGQPLPECAVEMRLKWDSGKLVGTYKGGTGAGKVELSK